MSELFSEDPKAVVQSEREWKPSRFSRPASNPRRLYVTLKNERRSFSTTQLNKIFSSYGVVEDMSIPSKRNTAFVTMDTKEAADKAIANVRKHNPEIDGCFVAHPRREKPYYRGGSHHNRHKNRTNSWRDDRYSSDNAGRRKASAKREKDRDSKANAKESKKHFESSLSSQAPCFASANSYQGDDVNQLGPQFAQMNLHPNLLLNFENTPNALAMGQMDPAQRPEAYNQHLVSLYGGLPIMNPSADQEYAFAQTIDPRRVQNGYDAHNMSGFRFYQPPHPFFLPFPQCSDNPYGLVQFQEQPVEKNRNSD